MKKSICFVSLLVVALLAAFSFSAKSACGSASNAECYSFDNGERHCISISEWNAGNCTKKPAVLERFEK